MAVALAGAALASPAAPSAGAQAGSAHDAHAAVTSQTACGSAAPEALAQTVGSVAKQIYEGEVSSPETVKDRHQVESYAPLLRAVAGGGEAAVKAAVTSLVYSHTHIVRLRVSRGSKLLADVGGPYVLAPLSGTLRLHGRTVGHYTLSVQDDLGFVKIETHYIGAPLVLRAGLTGAPAKRVPVKDVPANDVPVAGLLAPGPAGIPEHGPVTYRHVIYQAYSFDASAFPSGTLRISLLVPLPAGLSRKSCTTIRHSELAAVARRVFGRLALAHVSYSTDVQLVRTLTSGLFYVRAGSRQLAGSTRPGPARLPLSGSVSYRGARYEVFSFPAPGSVGTGASGKGAPGNVGTGASGNVGKGARGSVGTVRIYALFAG
ncbi:MAG TPA: hypothetical protein VGX72_14345 [Solirubrobacteraceae bacterium]|nr:hypothetical protein [Solirubrobacteraceae bacterium]